MWKISYKRIGQQYSIKIELFPASILESLAGLSNIERPWTQDSVSIHRFISICIGVSSIVKNIKVDFAEITFGRLFVIALKLLWEEDKILIVFHMRQMTKTMWYFWAMETFRCVEWNKAEGKFCWSFPAKIQQYLRANLEIWTFVSDIQLSFFYFQVEN